MSFKRVIQSVVGTQTGQLYRVVSWHDCPQAESKVFYCVEARGNATDTFDGWGDEGGEYDTIEEAIECINHLESIKWLDLLERKAEAI